jgi:4-aminobutyrate aminotransferase-like enzyme/Ser/Thr protein kinase RdoA (MazF antagonist)
MSVKNVLEQYYNLQAITHSSLEGYDSINYKVESKQGTFVLKQQSYSDETLALLEAENAVLARLSSLKDYDFPIPTPSFNNELIVVDNDQIYRLLSFIEGDFLGDVPHKTELMHSIGSFLGQLDKELEGYHHSAIVGKGTQWDLKSFKSNHQYIKYISNPKERNIVAYFFMQFDEHVYPIQHQLRKSVIYNDANHWNVLTQNGKLSGVIDFGDMCYSWLINEVAIALTYVMMHKADPLAIAAPLIKGYQSVYPLNEQELDILYYLIAARLCTSVCNSAYAKTLKPDSEYITISEKPAWDLLHKWLAINPIKAKDSFRTAAGFELSSKKPTSEQSKRRDKNFSKALSLSYKDPIQMSQSAFQYMYDADGNTFLDAYNNIMLAGHCHPTVVKAGQKAMANLNTNTRYLYEELLQYSEKLLAKFPESLNKVFFVNSGSAASDLAIRLATNHTKKQKVMVLEHGYHGNTRIGIDISHYKYNHKGGPGKQEYIVATPMPKAFGSGFEDNGDAGNHYAQLTKDQINLTSNQVAAFIAEPIVGCGGQVPLAKGYLEQVYREIRTQGGVCISDEVQVGFGRLGDCFWGYEMYDVVPDMVILGKPMANGHPIGAVVTTSEIAESFANGLEFFSSFGGNPVTCAIGDAVLDVIAEEGLQQHSKNVGDYLITLLKQLQKKYSELADIRGSGLFLGIEILNDDGKPGTQLASKIKNGLREQFILVSTDGPYDNVIKIKPPLSFTNTDVDILVKAIQSILS